MDSTRISVARLVELGVGVSWREAGAVVFEAVMLARSAGGEGAVADPAGSCLLTRGGKVELIDEAAEAAPEALLPLLDHLLTCCVDQDRLGKAHAAGHSLTFLAELGERTSPQRRRVEIAGLALRALAAEADLALATRPASAPPLAAATRRTPPARSAPAAKPAATRREPAAAPAAPRSDSRATPEQPRIEAPSQSPPRRPIAARATYATRPNVIARPQPAAARAHRPVATEEPAATFPAHEADRQDTGPLEDSDAKRPWPRAVPARPPEPARPPAPAQLSAPAHPPAPARPSAPARPAVPARPVVRAAPVPPVEYEAASPSPQAAQAPPPVRESRRAHHDPADFLLDTSAVPRRGTATNRGGGSGRVWAAMMIGLAMLTVAGAWWWMLAPTSRGTPAPRPAAVRPVEQPEAARAVPVPAAPVPVPPEPINSAAPAVAPPPTAAPRAPASATATSSPPTAPAPAARSEVPPVAADPAAVPSDRDDAIFSSTSPGVEPPAPLTPLPTGTTVIPGDTASGPFVEVLVDRNGQVEDVKLRGEPGAALARYQAAVIAVRRWRFVPAQLNGTAVRYALRVVLPP